MEKTAVSENKTAQPPEIKFPIGTKVKHIVGVEGVVTEVFGATKNPDTGATVFLPTAVYLMFYVDKTGVVRELKGDDQVISAV